MKSDLSLYGNVHWIIDGVGAECVVTRDEINVGGMEYSWRTSKVFKSLFIQKFDDWLYTMMCGWKCIFCEILVSSGMGNSGSYTWLIWLELSNVAMCLGDKWFVGVAILVNSLLLMRIGMLEVSLSMVISILRKGLLYEWCFGASNWMGVVNGLQHSVSWVNMMHTRRAIIGSNEDVDE